MRIFFVANAASSFLLGSPAALAADSTAHVLQFRAKPVGFVAADPGPQGTLEGPAPARLLEAVERRRWPAQPRTSPRSGSDRHLTVAAPSQPDELVRRRHPAAPDA